MYTSVACVVLAGLFGPTALPVTEPVWVHDYFAGQKEGRKEQRPLAVFVGSGPAGFEKIAQEGKFTDQTKKVLKDYFVCVYLDTSVPSSKELASALAITKGVGLIVSDRTGQLQAFHCDGTIPESDLVRNLNQFANSEYQVQNTITYPPVRTRTSFYQPSSAPANC